MSSEAWSVDLVEKIATHTSGFTVRFEGNPRDPSSVYPGVFPKELSALDQVRLLRAGVEAIGRARPAARTVEKPAVKPAKPRHVAENKPKRPVLSLKKRSDTPA